MLPLSTLQNPDNYYVKPETELESLLSVLWQDILDIERVGINDDFFRVGGDSILSIQLVARMRREGLVCSVKAVFEQRTIKRLAQLITQQQTKKRELKAEQGLLTGAFALLPIQSWFFAQKFAKSHWNQSSLIKVPELDIEILRSMLPVLADYHDMLRIRFVKTLDGYHQYYQDNMKPPLFYQMNVNG